jgi:hypothetical protein
MSIKIEIQNKKDQLIQMTSRFCQEYLDQEHENLCKKMIEKMARKRVVPFLAGKLEIWAASIIYAIGRMNFLFDKSFEPCSSPDEICDYFKASKSTVGQKAKVIHDLFKLGHFNSEFSTETMKQRSPFNRLAMINGYVIMLDA